MTIGEVRSIKDAFLHGLMLKIAMAPFFFLFTLALNMSTAQAGTGTSMPKKTESKADKTFSGNISWYGTHFNGKKTASGEIFDMGKKTAAHRSLAFSSKVMVEDPRTGGSVVVKVNDRGPFVKTRVMDISRGAATTLGTLNRGVCYVDCTVLGD
jgi:rare lipoprotein A